MLTNYRKPCGSNQELGWTPLLLPHNTYTLGEDCHPSLKSWFAASKIAATLVWLSCFLSCLKHQTWHDDQTITTKRKLPDVTQIMDWIQCFSIYIAVVSHAKPDHIADLIAYLNLIINIQRWFQYFDWALYDRQFWQKAAITPSLQWGTMEATLWNLSFLNHSTRPSFSARLFPSTPSTIKVPICLEWNEDPHKECLHLNCR